MQNWKLTDNRRLRVLCQHLKHRLTSAITKSEYLCFEIIKKGANRYNPISILAINSRYTWRIDLAKTEKFWTGWFEGLSQKFLDLRVPKLLLLASIDGLDRTLTVGQMQGKFQMQVLARCGHAVHEDRPHEVAEVIAAYMVRNKFAQQSNDFDRPMPAC